VPNLRAAPAHENRRTAAEIEAAVKTGSSRKSDRFMHGAGAPRLTCAGITAHSGSIGVHRVGAARAAASV